ncbi:MAG: hypothetical protein MI922_17225 [Bacteroidales bacterium]|nr:hypothetical protein [Bacteroidales bacterium]
MRYYVFIFTGIIILLACAELNSGINKTQKRAGCYTSSPLEELVWLKDLTNGLKLSMMPVTPGVYQYSYKNDTVFTLELDMQIKKVYNCSGEIIAKCMDDTSKLCSELQLLPDINKKLIWRNDSW